MIEYLSQYKTPEVRDLAWAIASPPLVTPTDEALWPNADWYLTAYRNVEEQLLALDQDPAPLLEKIATRNANRLGFYFEALIEMWCELEPAIELIAANPQVYREDGSTAGAFDFLVAVNGEVEHWECAVKFYLGQPDSQPPRWYGPNRKDRLDLKLGHMQSNQLRLADTDAGKAWLGKHDIQVARQRSIVKGKLFYPFNQNCSAPANQCSNHLKSLWMDWSEFETSFRNKGKWIHLPRQHWLAPRSATELAGYPTVERGNAPQQLSRCEGTQEVERLFVVPEGWANR